MGKKSLERRVYTEEFKAEAVALAEKKEKTVSQIAKNLGINDGILYRWIQQARRAIGSSSKAFPGHGRPRDEELTRLKKVACLMRENGLNVRRKRLFIRTTDSKHTLPVCENILNREFYAERGGVKWVSDITYLRTEVGWVYLTVVLDLFDRKVIGWALSTGMETSDTAIAALKMAVKNRSPQDALIFHSDRGVQYCAQSFRGALYENCPTVRQSMSRRGNCWDNACAESFFKTLKRELETLDGKHSEAEVRQSVFFYIEAYYNRVRMHSVLDYVAPNVFYSNKVA